MALTQINKPNLTIPADVWTELLPAMSSVTIMVGAPAQVFPFHSRDAMFFVGPAPPLPGADVILIEGITKLNRWGDPLTFGSDDPTHKLYGKPVDPGRPALLRLTAISSGAGGVDAVARALAQVPTGEAGEAIGPGEERIIGGHLYTNPTATAINVPATTTPAAVLAAGFAEPTPVSELYNAIQTAANVTHTAMIRGVLAQTGAAATETRFPEGLPIGTERRISRRGANVADAYIADGLTEIIDGTPDGGVRLNVDNSYVMIKKTSATTWVTHEVGQSGAGGGGTATPSGGYTHTQTVAATVWTVNHNLGYRPLVQAYDAAGDDLGSLDFKHVSINQLTLTFAAATSGEARCA